MREHRRQDGRRPSRVCARIEDLEQRVCLSSALAAVRTMLTSAPRVQTALASPKLLVNATHFSLAAPASVTAATPFTVTVSALDSQNRGVASYGGTVHFSSTDPSAVLPPDYTFVPGIDGDAGTADFTVTLAHPGSQSITVTQTNNASVAGTAQVLVMAPSSVSLSSNQPWAAVGQPVTLTAVVNAPAVPPGFVGTVDFLQGTFLLGTTPVQAGIAQFTTSSLQYGTHPITAHYEGDPLDQPSTSGTVIQEVRQPTASVSLSASAQPGSADPGTPITLVATVTGNAQKPTGELYTPTGYVDFAVAGTSFHWTLPLTALSPGSGRAAASVPLPPGNDSLTAIYEGDGTYFPATMSAGMVQVLYSTTTTLTSDSNPLTEGPVSLHVNVQSGAASAPGGDVTFSNGNVRLGTATLQGGQATLIVPLSAGQAHLIAQYAGDSVSRPSEGVLDLTVNDAPLTEVPSSTPLQVVEGANLGGVLAAFTDANRSPTLSDLTATVDWGDGSPSQPLVIGSDPLLSQLDTGPAGGTGHAYPEEGNYPLVITVHDAGGSMLTIRRSVTVIDPPVLAAASGVSVRVGDATPQPLATFTDPGGPEPVADYQASIDWGDQASSAGAITLNASTGLFTITGGHSYATAGDYTARITITHDSAPPVTVPLSVRAFVLPRVTAAAFSYDRRPNTLSFTFNTDVSQSIASAGAGAVRVQNLTTGLLLIPTTITYDPSTNTATFGFGGAIPDGSYRATLLAASVSDSLGNQIDGNADGNPGGDFVYNFFALTGDLDRNRTVGFSDLLILAQHYGSRGGYGAGDLNSDGTIDFSDLLLLAQNYGKAV